ncbi:MAG TPA: hypothetical protein VK962_03125 [Actinomycetota bacterium]|jgi:hypothetical protein|nr:hypothetical protein [Actinomycetota bacterium]
MANRVTVERWGDRPAWHVRVDGLRVGVVFKDGREFRAVREGYSTPESGSFSTRDSAAKALARLLGHRDVDPHVVDLDERRARGSRSA